LLSEDSYLAEGLQSADKTKTPKSKVTKRTHFYRKWKPPSCLFTFGNENENLYLPIMSTTIGRYEHTNWPIPIIGCENTDSTSHSIFSRSGREIFVVVTLLTSQMSINYFTLTEQNLITITTENMRRFARSANGSCHPYM